MQIDYQVDQRDYKIFFTRYYFERDINRRLFFLLVISLVIGTFRQEGTPFELSSYIEKTLIAAVTVFFIGTVVPYLISKMRLKNDVANRQTNDSKTMYVETDGLSIESPDENSFWTWEKVRTADTIRDYLFVALFTNKVYVIPLASFSSKNHAANFLKVVKNRIDERRAHSKDRKLHNLYKWGLIGFIPNVGAIAGVILTIKGLNYKDKKLILIGISCILFTALFWIVAYNFLSSDMVSNNR